MTVKEISESIGLQEDRHFRLKKMKVPVIETEYYTSLGRDLYELYRKYNVSRDDQRKIESLAYALVTFTMSRNRES